VEFAAAGKQGNDRFGRGGTHPIRMVGFVLAEIVGFVRLRGQRGGRGTIDTPPTRITGDAISGDTKKARPVSATGAFRMAEVNALISSASSGACRNNSASMRSTLL
jgi:hypothetical protein